MTYKYLDPKDLEEIPIKHSFLLLGELGLNAIDAKHLPLLEAAMTGNFFANCELVDAFTQGNIEGIPVNYKYAWVFADAIHKTNLQGGDAKSIIESAKNLGIIFEKLEKLDEAITYYHEAIKIMTDKMPPVEWDFSIYQYLEDAVLQRQQYEPKN